MKVKPNSVNNSSSLGSDWYRQSSRSKYETFRIRGIKFQKNYNSEANYNKYKSSHCSNFNQIEVNFLRYLRWFSSKMSPKSLTFGVGAWFSGVSTESIPWKCIYSCQAPPLLPGHYLVSHFIPPCSSAICLCL